MGGILRVRDCWQPNQITDAPARTPRARSRGEPTASPLLDGSRCCGCVPPRRAPDTFSGSSAAPAPQTTIARLRPLYYVDRWTVRVGCVDFRTCDRDFRRRIDSSPYVQLFTVPLATTSTVRPRGRDEQLAPSSIPGARDWLADLPRRPYTVLGPTRAGLSAGEALVASRARFWRTRAGGARRGFVATRPPQRALPSMHRPLSADGPLVISHLGSHDRPG